MGNIVIRKNEDILKARDKIQHSLKSVKAIDARLYLGKLRIKDDALAYQKEVRKEWDTDEHAH